ncbi:hypothetical protein OIE67_10715 [Nonomuraea fuscirosea]|uniref:hypothetical protein n=1 Tax=Nonomuraea fuscirosea TaxID=1291556 RepID=UPI002DDAF966|nr:hypothetical protein [Nonomuraea fuscirosea]WSA55055.1 hypothetical protein OIE67_10715 [Nonomuraea fuscirosea]
MPSPRDVSSGVTCRASSISRPASSELSFPVTTNHSISPAAYGASTPGWAHGSCQKSSAHCPTLMNASRSSSAYDAAARAWVRSTRVSSARDLSWPPGGVSTAARYARTSSSSSGAARARAAASSPADRVSPWAPSAARSSMWTASAMTCRSPPRVYWRTRPAPTSPSAPGAQAGSAARMDSCSRNWPSRSETSGTGSAMARRTRAWISNPTCR